MEDMCVLPLPRKFPDGPHRLSCSIRSDPASPAGWTCRAPPPGSTRRRAGIESDHRNLGHLCPLLKAVTRVNKRYWISEAAGVSPRTPAHPACPLPGWTHPHSRRTEGRS